jgi:hypothetical protein
MLTSLLRDAGDRLVSTLGIVGYLVATVFILLVELNSAAAENIWPTTPQRSPSSRFSVRQSLAAHCGASDWCRSGWLR